MVDETSEGMGEAERRTYILIGAGIVIFAIAIFAGVPIEQVLLILGAFGLGGAIPSPIK